MSIQNSGQVTIRQLIRAICFADNDSPDFIEDRTALAPILKDLNRKLPEDFLEYLDHCVPNQSYGRMVEFHSLNDLIIENRDTIPGADTIHQGLFCFAKEGDGSQFAYCPDDSSVYHIDPVVAGTSDEIKAAALQSWPSLSEFLIWYLEDLKKVLAEFEE